MSASVDMYNLHRQIADAAVKIGERELTMGDWKMAARWARCARHNLRLAAEQIPAAGAAGCTVCGTNPPVATISSRASLSPLRPLRLRRARP